MPDIIISRKYKRPTNARNTPYTFICWMMFKLSANKSVTTTAVKMLCKQYAKYVFTPNISP